MNNFTKSVLYSAAVLVAGLVAISAIYNNTSPNGADFANMSPAAGNIPESDIGIDFSHMIDDTKKKALDVATATGEAFEDASEIAAEKADEASAALDSIATAAGEAISDAVDTAEETIDTAAPEATAATPQDSVEDAANTAKEAVSEAAAETAETIEPAAAATEEIIEEGIVETPAAE